MGGSGQRRRVRGAPRGAPGEQVRVVCAASRPATSRQAGRGSSDTSLYGHSLASLTRLDTADSFSVSQTASLRTGRRSVRRHRLSSAGIKPSNR